MAKMLSWETAALRGDGQEDGPVGAAGKEGREAELPGQGGTWVLQQPEVGPRVKLDHLQPLDPASRVVPQKALSGRV